jgi:putative spermidine/putrescine transport system substrate-binding protein
MTRRSWTRARAAAPWAARVTFTALAAVAHGCGSADPGGERAAAPEITLLAFQTGGFREQYIKAVTEPFERERGVKVNFYGVRNSATELAVLRAHKGQTSPPPADVTVIDLSVAKIARDESLLEEIRKDRVPNGASLGSVGAELGWHGLPVTYDTLALVYDPRTVSPAPTSWNALWDAAHRGRVAIPAEGGGDIQAIALTIVANRLAGNDDVLADVGPGVQKLAALAPSVQTWEPKPDVYTLVVNGSIAMGIGWNARSQLHVAEAPGRIAAVTPAEGTVAQVNVLGVVAGTRQRDLAEDFVNYALSAEVQARFSSAMHYAPTNTAVRLGDDVARRIPLFDEAQRQRLIPVDWLKVGEARERILEPWRRTIIPASR